LKEKILEIESTSAQGARKRSAHTLTIGKYSGENK